MTTFAIYMPQSFSQPQFGGGASFRYYSIIRDFLADDHCVLLFSPNTVDDMIRLDHSFKTCILNRQLNICHLPVKSNAIYPEFKITDMSISIMYRIYQVLTQEQAHVMVCSDCPESAIILNLSVLAGVPNVVYGIHTDLHRIFQTLKFPWIVKSAIHALLVLHHNVSSWCATHTATSSRVFQIQFKQSPLYRFLRFDGIFESSLWSSAFQLPSDSHHSDRAHWRDVLTQGHPESPLLVYVGRLSPEKRVHLLPDILPHGWKLAITGDGPEDFLDKVHSFASSDIYVHRQFFSAETLRSVYHAADFIVSASDFETLGFVALESIACGTPVAVQSSGGFLENVIHRKNGLLMDFSDADQCRHELEQFRPGTDAYIQLKHRTQQYATTIPKPNSRTFTERFISHHAPHTAPHTAFKRLLRIPVLISTYLVYKVVSFVFG